MPGRRYLWRMTDALPPPPAPAARPTREQVERYLRTLDLARRPEGMSREAFQELRRRARALAKQYRRGVLVHEAVREEYYNDLLGARVRTRTAGQTYRRPLPAPPEVDPAPGPDPEPPTPPAV